MWTTPSSKLLARLYLLIVGAQAEWPVKTVDFTNGGHDCELSAEQYLQLEVHDFHDHPKFTLRWRQIAGPCGEVINTSSLAPWEASYDGSALTAEDDTPSEGDSGRVQLSLFVCSPFGEYEIDLEILSFSDENSTLERRTSWLIKTGVDEFNVWDTVNTGLSSNEDYSPTVPGEYTWPLEGTTGYYGAIIAGPSPPLECVSGVPAGTTLVGCFNDSIADRLLGSAELVLNTRGPGGMTAQVCSYFCSGFDYFGLEFGGECFCGTAEDFEESTVSENCGLSSEYLCTGDPSTACGGWNSISVYHRKFFSLKGCFKDGHSSRIMDPQGSHDVLSAEICYEQCNDGVNTHFGTQYAIECWCGADTDLTKNGEELPSEKCDMLCAGTTVGEHCGGNNTMTAYEIELGAPSVSEYIGCYADAPIRAMDAEEVHLTGNMTNLVCISFCGDNGHAYAGTEYSTECWCGDSYDRFGEISDGLCDYPCEGDAGQRCGGFYALSVHSTD
eukprot:jgi/Undpi1/5266/HiC_scaffold_2.g00547.m1